MATINDKFKRTRLDQSPYLFHFINGRDTTPADTLQKILEEQWLISSKGYICFSASPITAITKFFDTPTQRTGRPMYLPWGLGFSRDILVRDFGARNVIYTDGSENIPEYLKWRTDILHVDSYDFEYLREWRIKGKTFDFKTFPQKDIIVVAPDHNSLNHLVVKFDMQFTPYVNYYNGDIEEDWTEAFTREWKGVSVDKLGVDYLDDYAVSGATISQLIDEDMFEKLLLESPLSLGMQKKTNKALTTMEDKKYYCYVCDNELTEENKSDEHIILNAIGGHLHSYTIMCKDCNSKLGEMADAKLAEDLSFYTDILCVKKNRQNRHRQIMTNEDGQDIIVEGAGEKLKLRRPYVKKESDGDNTQIQITARNLDELKGLLKGLIKDKTLPQKDADKIMEKATMKEYRPRLKKTNTISTVAFPSIVKSAVNYYVDIFHDVPTIKHLIPYIKGEKDTKEVLYLHHFKELPYEVTRGQITHMIHLEGDKSTKLLYAMMEYYGIFIYIVVLDSNYLGDPVNKTYTYDTVSATEIDRSFSLPLTLDDLEKFRNQSHDEYLTYLPYVKRRADGVMKVWQERQYMEGLKQVVNDAFGKYPEGCILTEEILKDVENDIMRFFERKINESF